VVDSGPKLVNHRDTENTEVAQRIIEHTETLTAFSDEDYSPYDE